MKIKFAFETLHQHWHDLPGGLDDQVESKLLAEIYRSAAADAIKNDELFMAEELARLGCHHATRCGESTTRFHQLRALALARSGSVQSAYHLLLRLSSIAQDQESAGLLARTLRDIGWAEADPVRRRQFFKEAYLYVRDSFQRSTEDKDPKREANYYNAIQAAQFAFFAGDDQCFTFLNHAEKECLFEEAQGNPDPMKAFWRAITRAEIELIRGLDLEKTIELYRKANQLGEAYEADRRACWVVAKKLLEQHHRDEWNELLKLFRGRSVVVFSGHQFDNNPAADRFPAELSPQIAAAMAAELERIKPKRIFTSHSFGADLLFLEAALQIRIPVTLVLAFDRERAASDFERAVRSWADFHSPEAAQAWVKRSERVLSILESGFHADSDGDPPALGQRHRIHEIQFPMPPGEGEDPSLAYDHTNQLMTGLAMLEARQSDSPIEMMVVLREAAEGKLGGSADFISRLDGRIQRIHNFLCPS